MTPSDARAQALAEARFFAHLSVFAVVVSVLLGVNLVIGGALWAPWVGVAWALVVVSHASAVFGHVFGGDWVERRAALLRVTPNADALRQLEYRLARIEGSAGVVGGRLQPADLEETEDPFDLTAARAVGRPIEPDRIGVSRGATGTDDPFAMAREPIETPRLDGPRPRPRDRA